jgi:hypothetical protein
MAIIQGRYVYYVNPRPGVASLGANGEHYLHAGGASIIVGLVTLALVVTASITLARRDVI